jgi:radical SAM/Cys-rich protein
MLKSLQQRESDLTNSKKQLNILKDTLKCENLPQFTQKIGLKGDQKLKPTGLEIFQMNLGYMCNQVCAHCHVDAGPDRKEIMDWATMEQCIKAVKDGNIHTVDLTGGAPEMNPHFRPLVEELRKAGAQEIIIRSNLTIILANKKYHDLPHFFAKNNCRVVSSLPYYDRDKVDKQRGEGVFAKSIEALKMLNAVGYGMPDSGLFLDLVYNPSGAFLPGNQTELERDFKKALLADFDIQFNSLFCITNIPLSRFLDYLIASDNLEDYMYKLVEAFNPSAVDGVMCRNTISIDYLGNLYDCDFNQMLELKTPKAVGQHISEFNIQKLNSRSIIFHDHCYGCTAGAGSSCQGTTV